VLSTQSEDSDDESDENHIIRNNEISDINQSEETENNISSVNNSASKDIGKIKGNDYCRDDDLIAEMSRGPTGDKKSNFCIYCNTMQTKIARHFELKHSNEKEIVKFLSLPKGSYERKKLIGDCRKKGNYKFNTHADINNGRMIVVRRPNNEAKQGGSHFLPCSKCGGHYAKTNLRHLCNNRYLYLCFFLCLLIFSPNNSPNTIATGLLV
jgi:hypothetical protein